VDLKSAALALLLEQMGLASPARYMFCLREHDHSGNQTNYLVIQRSFDPASLFPVAWLNNVLFTYQIVHSEDPHRADVLELPADPLAVPAWPMASWPFATGQYTTNLTRDDAGGLRYLLSTNNANVEEMLPNVQLAADGSTNFVNRALRPGWEKINFAPLATESGTDGFITTTNWFADTYITNGAQVKQTLKRIVTRPDILFSAADLGVSNRVPRLFARSDTSRWTNNDALNGASQLDGPGVIQPPVTITFSKLGPLLLNSNQLTNQSDALTLPAWGWFDGSTNPPIVFPTPGSYRDVLARLQLVGNNTTWTLSLWLSGQFGERYRLETSTDLVGWGADSTITNRSWVVDFTFSTGETEPRRFFRVVAE
jgi:hypothetical protein